MKQRTERQTPSRHLSFSQRYGHAPLPKVMELGELSSELRLALSNKFYEVLNGEKIGSSLLDTLQACVVRILGRFSQIPGSRVSKRLYKHVEYFESIFMQDTFNRVLDLCEIIINELDRPTEKKYHFSESVKELFNIHQAAYWLDTSQRPYQFMPCANPEQGIATQEAIKTLRDGGMDGAVIHLREAAEHINIGQYADSVKDSILAVESVARKIDPQASSTLTPALRSLEKAGILTHPALKSGFEKLYGYASDKEGIRHAIVFKKDADVGQDEALYMFGSCASFAAYLVHKNRKLQG